MTAREIWADYDDEGIVVYQAFKPSIAAAAVRAQTFPKGQGFNRARMTWIKPSFGWMLHRSDYARKRRMQAILRIRLRRAGLLELLAQAISTSFEPSVHADEETWRRALDASEVRYQWDPDRDLETRPLARRALQLGIRGDAVQRYVDDWILGIEERTELAHQLHDAIQRRRPLPAGPLERPLPVSPAIRHALAMDVDT
ncbi:MAG: DUF4291 domain-containing protein [Myxococcales bacterium]|nr:DUF4291 domain-containing protein [Myxococcales bacterium]